MINKIKSLFKESIKFKKNKNILIFKSKIKLILFLKYIFLVFLFCFTIFLLAPKFFDYNDKKIEIKKSLEKNYNIELKKYSYIKYKVFPSPRIYIENANLVFKESKVKASVKELAVILKVNQIYNFKDLKISKISLNRANLTFELDNIFDVLKFAKNIKNKILIQESNLSILNKNLKLVKLGNIKVKNLKKNYLILKGIYLDQEFEIKYLNQIPNHKLNFKMPRAGINGKVIFSNSSNLNFFGGAVRMKVLNSNLKFSFEKKKNLKIYNSLIRNKNFKSTFNGIIHTYPYFNFDHVFKISDMNTKNFVKIRKIIQITDLLKINKKINGKIRVLLDNNNPRKEYIKKADISIFLENGNITVNESSLEFGDGKLSFLGNFSNYEDFGKFNFKLLANIINTNQLFKKFNVVRKKKNKSTDLEVEGFFTLPSGNVNFDKILIDSNNRLGKKDLLYLKEKFNLLVIDDNLNNLMNYNNVKNFIELIYR